MGDYNYLSDRFHGLSFPAPPTDEERRKAEADADALRFLAEMHCPEDVVRFGEAHRISAFAEMTWLNGFQAGWRAYHSRKGENT